MLRMPAPSQVNRRAWIGAELLLELRERGEHQPSAVLLAAEVALLQAVAVPRERQRVAGR